MSETITVDVVRHLVVMALANILKNSIEACATDSEGEYGVVKVQAVNRVAMPTFGSHSGQSPRVFFEAGRR